MSNTYYVTLPTYGTLIGATVTAVVYTTLATTGEIAAAATETGIELTGNILAFGTELVAGSIAGNTIRTASKTYGTISRPIISNSSRIGAMGLSVLAGGLAAVTTTALVNSGAYLYSYYKEYKQDYKEDFMLIDIDGGSIELVPISKLITESITESIAESIPECNNSLTESPSP
jgi:hypothetical protein